MRTSLKTPIPANSIAAIGPGGSLGGLSARLMPTESAKATILEIQVNAALAGHDLGPLESVESFEGAGYQARRRRCDQTTWVGESGLLYSLLEEMCGSKS